MKKALFSLFLIIYGTLTNAQNGLENIIVEKYYISNAADSVGSIGILPVGSTTYRIYVDMLPGYKFQAAYGVPGHALTISSTKPFFNNEDRGATTPAFSKTNAAKNTVMLDSWLSVGEACTGNFGILKSEDDGVANAVNANGILQNNNAGAGIPLTTQDGFLAGAPQAVTFVGITSTDLDVFDAVSLVGNSFTTSNGSWASLNGSTGPVPATNRVLIAQMTTNGCFSFELNVQIGTPNGGVENYVARNPVGSEILFPGLTYNAASVSIAANPAGPVCAGSSITFTATAINGGTTPVYQWKKNGSTVGTNSPTFTNSNLLNNDVITCKVTSNAASLCSTNIVTSNAITVNISPVPTATITPTGPTTFCSGTNALTLSANAGTGNTYQWYKGTTAVAGATGINYIPTATNTYKVKVTNSNGCTKSSSGLAVTVLSLPSSAITPTGPTTFCSGTNPLTLTANSGTGLTYQWVKGTSTVTVIAGATNISYVPTSSNTYKVQVTNANGCSKQSSGVAVSVKSLPSATITAQGPTTFCAGDSVVLAANAGTGYTYQWLKSNVNISGATSINYTAKVAGSYKVVVTNTNTCSKTSSSKSVTVNCKEGELAFSSDENQLLVFPNPANGPVTLKFSDESIEDGHAKVELVNILGQPVMSFNTEIISGQFEQQLNTEQMAKGVYFVKVSLHDVTYDSKLIIQ